MSKQKNKQKAKQKARDLDEVLGFTREQIQEAALVVVVSEAGEYEYISTRTQPEVVQALETIRDDIMKQGS